MNITQKFVHEDSALSYRLGFVPLYSAQKRLSMMIEETRSVVRSVSASCGADPKEGAVIDRRHYLLPGMISGIYHLFDHYLWEVIHCFKDQIENAKYTVWFESNADKIKKSNHHHYLFNVYKLKTYRNKVMVHPKGIDHIPGSLISGSDDYTLWFASGHIMAESMIDLKLKEIRELLRKYELSECEFHLQDFDDEQEDRFETVELLFENFKCGQAKGQNEARRLINNLVQIVGCTSHSLNHIDLVADNLLPSLFQYLKESGELILD